MKTKSDFEEIAANIRQLKNDEKELAILVWIDRFKKNPRFREDLFRQSCMGKLSVSRKELVAHYFQLAGKAASEEVERLARQILAKNDDLHEFTMAMGTWFFSRTKKEAKKFGGYDIIHSNEDDPRFKELEEFISEWDDAIKITGEPMRFTAKGKIVRDW